MQSFKYRPLRFQIKSIKSLNRLLSRNPEPSLCFRVIKPAWFYLCYETTLCNCNYFTVFITLLQFLTIFQCCKVQRKSFGDVILRFRTPVKKYFIVKMISIFLLEKRTFVYRTVSKVGGINNFANQNRGCFTTLKVACNCDLHFIREAEFTLG